MSLKYLHVVNKITKEMAECLQEVPRRSGMYNWLFLFKGEIAPYSLVEDFEKYDVIQVNMSPVDQIMMREIRKRIPKSSSTLLIGNNDYVAETWETWGQHPLEYQQIQEVPDGVFGTEPYQVSSMIDGAFTIPHPSPLHYYKRIGNDDLEPEQNNIANIYHWWEGGTYTQSSILERLRKEHPKITTRLYAHGENGLGRSKSLRWVKAMFDKTMPMMRHPDYIRSLMTNKFVFDNCPYHTYGRTSVDTAALRIPTIGSNRIFSLQHNFPNMCADPYDAKKLLEIMRKTLKGGSWLDDQMDYAYDACEYFNYANSKKRYLEMVDEIRTRTGK